MPYPIERKLVIAIASSALFDSSIPHRVFEEKGVEAYRKFQRENQKIPLPLGVAFPFIRRFLRINENYPDQKPVEVILLSKNDSDAGLRVMNSIHEYNLDISRAAFLKGRSPTLYIPAFNASLFLSANPFDVREAINAGFPAGTVIKTKINDEVNDCELRIAFDFDGVIVDDQAEQVYQLSHQITDFHSGEVERAGIPHGPGPLQDLFKKLSFFQKLEMKREEEDRNYKRVVRISIVTARNAPSHERVVTTLRQLNIIPDETFFLGGIDKGRILEVLKPHIYFDDQVDNLKSAAGTIPSVHIPFGVMNLSEKT